MKTNVLSLNVDKSMSFTRFQARIESSIKPFADDNCKFRQFEDIREMFVALQGALEKDELVITAVDVKNYLKFKNALIQAFGADIVYDPAVLNKIEGLELDDKKKKAFSAFPESATVFVSDDGLYSGFVMENETQYLILLPIDNNRIDGILRNGVVPFLNERIVVENTSIEIDEEKSANIEKVSYAVNSILESNSLVAVNGTRNAEVLKSCGDSVDGFNKAFVFTPYVEDKGDINPTEYTAQLARVSLDLSTANIGACISDIYTSGDLKYICIAVSKDDSALVRKLYMAENETEHDLVESAAIELIELVAEKASGKRSVGIEISDGENGENAITDDDKKIAKKKPLAILAIVIGIAIIICAVIGMIFQSQGNNGKMAGIFDSIFGRQETTTTPTTTQPVETTTNKSISVQAYDSSLMKLSDYIVAEVMKMDEAQFAEKSSLTDSPAPRIITVNGEKIEAKAAIARLITAEVTTGYRTEAIKAQTVAIYTCLKFLDNDFNIEGVRIAEAYNSIVKKAVDEVFGEYLTYNNTLALPLYHSLTAGSTLDMSSKLPYLKSVKLSASLDVSMRDYTSEKVYSVDEMKEILLENDSSLTLSDNPSEWFVIKSHDSSISDELGNVTSIVFNGVEMTGVDFRMKVLGEDVLPSVCFSITYDTVNAKFTVSSFGQGYGVGMGQVSAKYLATESNDYKAILAKFYEGTTLTKERTV